MTPYVSIGSIGMRQGDLVHVSNYVGDSNSRTLTITAGGQTWTTTKERNGGIPEIWTSWCTFNGTWSADPTFAISGSAVMKSTQMFIIRPPKVNAVWTVDQGPTFNTTGGASVTHVVTGVTNTMNNNITIARLITNTTTGTYNAHSPLSWVQIGTANFRNTGPNNKNGMYFILNQRVPSATGNLTVTTNALGNGFGTMHSLYYT